MAQVFLSYDREDAPRARVIAQALERADHFVWYDLHIKGGAEYGREIERALEQSDVVVVLWSEQSVASAWVRDEAAAGRDKGRLIPVLIEPVSPPMGFRQYQNLDFTGWKGRARPPRMAELLDSIEAIAGPAVERPAPETAKPSSARLPRTSLPKWLMIGGAVMLTLLILGPLVGLISKGRGDHGVYTVSVAAADSEAKPLARDLLVNLGRLQSARTGSLRLVSGGEVSSLKPDFIFESASDSDPDRVGASLVLMDGEDRSVLWSKDFEQPSGKLADLKQQVAFSAGRVLDCALEGLTAEARLKPQTFKDYLTGCSQIDELANTDPTSIVALLRNIIAESPRFEPAWRTLLTIQAGMTETAIAEGENNPQLRSDLQKMIADARKLDPDIAEATLAEISLLPIGDFEQALALADKADRQSPNNPIVLNSRSNLLRRVGRMRDSIYDAQRAATLDPLSPYTSNAYISSLYYAGRFEAAQQELAKAEQLWPGTETLADVKFRYHLRYGDPQEALKMAQAQGQERGLELFLKARIDPSQEKLSALRAFMDKRLTVTAMFGLSFGLQTAGEFGWEDYLYSHLLNWPRPEELQNVADIYFRPTLKKFRSDPRFMIIAKQARLLEYWQKTGNWPDFCAEPDLPYDCKAEAAKLSR